MALAEICFLYYSIKTRHHMGSTRTPPLPERESKQPTGSSFFGKAILGLIQVFTLNMIYFDIDSHNLYTHAIRRKQTPTPHRSR